MSNYIEYKDSVAFHPGYYIKEIIEESGLSQEDFAKRLGTTPKNLSILVRGDQSLSIDMASKLSRMLGTSVSYWLNLQQSYDERRAEILSERELEKERDVIRLIDYNYFRDNFALPDLPRKTDDKIVHLREFLSVSSLAVLEEEDLAVAFRSGSERPLSRSNVVNANAMVQVAVNDALSIDSPKFNRQKFDDAVDFALRQTCNHQQFLPVIRDAFSSAGVVLVVLPNLKNSGISGATKRLGGRILLMVNDRRHYEDTFWFALFHELGHIVNGEMGITPDMDTGLTAKSDKGSLTNDCKSKNAQVEKNHLKEEHSADVYARNKLIPPEAYEQFINGRTSFDESLIRSFAKEINRDPGIVYGRLQKDRLIAYSEMLLSKKLRHHFDPNSFSGKPAHR